MLLQGTTHMQHDKSKTLTLINKNFKKNLQNRKSECIFSKIICVCVCMYAGVCVRERERILNLNKKNDQGLKNEPQSH